ncbi:MAG: ASCH domain-containing protein [Acidobacteriia bacterium]|nr:ASCH domain-containing protein [Terriglobia bacterium]
MKALTLRPTWAWLVVNGHKVIENRSWPTRLRGRIWIHASSSRVTRAEYDGFLEVCRYRRIKKFPGRDDFRTGGIVGSVEVVDCVTRSRSYWFGGDYGFVLRNARRTRFKPMKGMLGFFEVRRP